LETFKIAVNDSVREMFLDMTSRGPPADRRQPGEKLAFLVSGREIPQKLELVLAKREHHFGYDVVDCLGKLHPDSGNVPGGALSCDTIVNKRFISSHEFHPSLFPAARRMIAACIQEFAKIP
jgi:hypothetical protein